MKQMILAAFVAAVALFPTYATAQGVHQLVVQSLAPEKTGPVVRSLAQTGQIPLSANAMIPAGYDFPSFSITVSFRDGTALLTTIGMTTLRDLATALQSDDLARSTFQVASHLSGGTSDPVSALPLSVQRAQTVAEHLTAFYGIDRNRLIPVGYGAISPAVGTNPADPLNDRIVLINVDELVR